jgi:hypothetical protein
LRITLSALSQGARSLSLRFVLSAAVLVVVVPGESTNERRTFYTPDRSNFQNIIK